MTRSQRQDQLLPVSGHSTLGEGLSPKLPRPTALVGILADGSLWEWAPASGMRLVPQSPRTLLRTCNSSFTHSHSILPEAWSACTLPTMQSRPGPCLLGAYLLVTDRPSATWPVNPRQAVVPHWQRDPCSELWKSGGAGGARAVGEETVQEEEVFLQLCCLFRPPWDLPRSQNPRS